MASSFYSSTYSLIALFFFFFLGSVSCQLSSNFYSYSCPNALSTIQSAVQAAVKNEARMGASLVRLHFHDCFVQGCDGSILLDDTSNFTGEKTARPNSNSVRGFDVVDNIKTKVEGVCPGIVSCADILAVAARDSVVALGGKSWAVQLGRRDSTTASLSSANTDIPAPTSSLSTLISSFSNKGLTAKEMVILSGAHTIGQARCTTFRTRCWLFSKKKKKHRLKPDFIQNPYGPLTCPVCHLIQSVAITASTPLVGRSLVALYIGDWPSPLTTHSWPAVLGAPLLQPV